MNYPTDAEYRDRLWSRCHIDERGCWVWSGTRGRNNYGQMSYRNSPWATHRLAHHLFLGPIPVGACVCHSCDNPACCNPQHLWLGDRRANNLDALAKGRRKVSDAPRRDSPPTGVKKPPKTHCKRGHELTEANVYYKADGRRRCRKCHVILVREAQRRVAERASGTSNEVQP